MMLKLCNLSKSTPRPHSRRRPVHATAKQILRPAAPHARRNLDVQLASKSLCTLTSGGLKFSVKRNLEKETRDSFAMREIAIRLPHRPGVVTFLLETSSYQSLTENFDEFACSDPYVSGKMKDNFPVFLYKTEKYKEGVQLAGNTKFIPEEVQVLDLSFAPRASPVKLNPAVNERVQDYNFTIDNPATGEVALRYDELLFELPQSEQNPQQNADIVILESFAEIGNQEDLPTIIEVPPQQQTHLISALKPSRKSKIRQETYIKETDCSLPKYSNAVKSILQRGDIVIESLPFVHETAEHVMTIKAQPKKADIETFVTFLLLNIPELDSAVVQNDPHQKIGNYLQGMILNYVRNKTYREKKKAEEVHKKVGKKGSISFHLSKEVGSSECDANSVKETTSDGRKTIEANKDLKKGQKRTLLNAEDDPLLFLKKKKFDLQVVLQKLPLSFEQRRKAIKEFHKISNITSVWPPFSHPDVINSEFLLTCPQLDPNILETRIHKILQRLGQIFNADCETEADKLRLLRMLEDKLQLSMQLRYSSAFSIENLAELQIPKKPANVRSSAPITLSYICNGGEIARVCLLAEDKVVAAKEKPTCVEVLKILIGSYYAYHYEYPMYLKNLFWFFEKELLDVSKGVRYSAKLKAFLKIYNDK
ncbi:Hypothetical predicted protein [Cloeon dipterum]|uniref:Uncharacterized protein n=1 Tax=Cloeon dipterum TaxID=197152 RepID=A0A8S1D8N3_9INSE|nr:Hypothetical predicted protein [Cloeon dipterum]